MTVLSKIRYIAFLLLLTAAVVSSHTASANEDAPCSSFLPCESCETPPGLCAIYSSGDCGQWEECEFHGFCTIPNDPIPGSVCDCGPCIPR